ncbi:MAG TPA: prepilin-type N-terminal cleavage/methylation domain-containing protein [Thermoanaerobaculia bacterium]|nr:prepilin-type N-terminal cleavage/methylation domain-containing protein [Thermoanaerobaculia bacterium]
MKLSSPLSRPLFRAPRPHGRRGFSLMEMMAVVAILGIVAVVGGAEISRTWKRQKLQSASTDIKVFFQRALPEMQRNDMPVLIQVGPAVPTGPPSPGVPQFLPIYLIGDADGDGVVSGVPCRNPVAPAKGCPDLLIDQFNIVLISPSGIDQEFSLSATNTSQIESTFWSSNVTDWDTPRFLRCDFQGRAINPASGRQVTAPATLVLTHVDHVRGSLHPPTRYVLSINPVWSVRVIKQTNTTPSDPATWVIQNG